jgi:small conductance mechanosensitive channel
MNLSILLSYDMMDDFMVVVGLIALLIGFCLVIFRLSGLLFRQLKALPALANYAAHLERAQGIIKWGARWLLWIGSLGIAGVGGYFIYRGQNVWNGLTILLAEAVPLSFWLGWGGGVVMAIILSAVVRRCLPLLDQQLQRAQEKVRTIRFIRMTEQAGEEIFARLRSALYYGLYGLVLTYAVTWLPLPAVVADTAFVVLKVYWIVALGQVLVRLVPVIVGTLDALSETYIRSVKLDEFYDQVHSLTPLFGRVLEYILHVQAATFAIMQIQWMAGFAYYGGIAIQLIVIFFLSRVVVELFNLVVDKFIFPPGQLTAQEEQQRLTFAPLVKSFGYYTTYAGAALAMLIVLNVEIGPILAAIGGIGLIAGLAAQPVLNDMVAGLFILFENLYMVGDEVEIGEASGAVEAIDIRTTHIRGDNGEIYMLRNGQIGEIISYSKGHAFAVVNLTVPYQVTMEQIEGIVGSVGEQAMATYPDVLEATVLEGIEEFGPTGMVVRTITKTKAGCHEQATRDVRALFKAAFDRAGISLAPVTTWVATAATNGHHAPLLLKHESVVSTN